MRLKAIANNIKYDQLITLLSSYKRVLCKYEYYIKLKAATGTSLISVIILLSLDLLIHAYFPKEKNVINNKSIYLI